MASRQPRLTRSDAMCRLLVALTTIGAALAGMSVALSEVIW